MRISDWSSDVCSSDLSLNLFTSWGDPARVAAEEGHFARLWANKAKRAVVLDVPQAARDDLLRFLPDPGELPRRLQKEVPEPADDAPPLPIPPEADMPPMAAVDLRRQVWDFIAAAPNMPHGGERVGEATSAVTPWPHQLRAFHRMYDNWPPRLLIADEVGLGKTIQAGLLVRQAWLEIGRAAWRERGLQYG